MLWTAASHHPEPRALRSRWHRKFSNHAIFCLGSGCFFFIVDIALRTVAERAEEVRRESSESCDIKKEKKRRRKRTEASNRYLPRRQNFLTTRGKTNEKIKRKKMKKNEK